MQLVCYNNWNQLPETADELFAISEKNSVFYSRQWFDCLTETSLDNQELVIVSVLEGERVLAILPLIKSNVNNLSSFKHRYTTHYSLLLSDVNQENILRCLAQGLSQLNIRSILLEPVAGDDENLICLQKQLEIEGYQCERYFRFYNWIHRFQEPSYQNYLNNRPSRLCNTISRKKKKLEREHGYTIQLYTQNDVYDAMHDYYAVYNASWKAHEQYKNLVDDMVGRFTKQGWTRLAVLYVKNEPIAAQLWFVVHDKASIFRLSYDEKWKAYSPGTILMDYLMAYVAEVDEVKEADFLYGNDSYKQDWMSIKRERFLLSFIKEKKKTSRFHKLNEFLHRWFNKLL